MRRGVGKPEPLGNSSVAKYCLLSANHAPLGRFATSVQNFETDISFSYVLKYVRSIL